MLFKGSATEGGIFAPERFVTRMNEEYVWIGMIPGMTGTVMPLQRI